MVGKEGGVMKWRSPILLIIAVIAALVVVGGGTFYIGRASSPSATPTARTRPVKPLEASKLLAEIAPGQITTVAGNVQRAGTFEGAFSGDGGPATLAGLNFPIDVAVDAAGNLYIADSINNRVRVVRAVSAPR